MNQWFFRIFGIHSFYATATLLNIWICMNWCSWRWLLERIGLCTHACSSAVSRVSRMLHVVIIIRLRRCSRHCWVHITPSRGHSFVLVLDVPGGGGLTPLRRCSRHCWGHLTPSHGPSFVLVLDVPGGGGINSLKAVFQTLLGSPYAIPWPFICFGLGRPRGGGD